MGSSDWHLCAGTGACEGDEAAVLTVGGKLNAETGQKTYLLGLAVQLAKSCAASGYLRISSVKDFICQHAPNAAGCPNGSPTGTIDVDTTKRKSICRWTAIEIHSIFMLMGVGFFGPLGVAVAVITKHMSWPPPGSKAFKKNPNNLNFLQQWDRALYMHITCMVLMYLFVIIGIIIVAVGVAPLNISGKE